jgi:putative spermidine/putrescine transport system ATP-binding protein/putrescine transport system ATP-binding protein
LIKVLEARGLVKRFGEVLALDGISFDLGESEIVSLLGPSGCGKTTTLRVIAGFEVPDEGVLRIAGKDVKNARPYQRNVGLVFQDYALFPHMTVEENISYGMRHRGVPRGSFSERTKRVLDLVKLDGFQNRRPGQLSGGEKQRVALARALVTEPEIMLLDEPLSNLDAKLRAELRIELKRILSRVGTSTIIVTHDQEEAMGLAGRVMVMNRGRIMQEGTPSEIYVRPNSRFVAEFIGRSNWFSATVNTVSPGKACCVAGEGIVLSVPAHDLSPGMEVEIGVRPEFMRINELHDADVDNALEGSVEYIDYLGPDIHVWIRLVQGPRILVNERNRAQRLHAIGSAVRITFTGSQCVVLPSVSRG